MSKSVKIQDSPEFKAFKENFEATMDAMEKDPEFAQMKLPEEWERDFKETMEATWEEERQRKKKRIGKRIAIAAGVTLVTLAGLNLGVQQVQGEGLVEFFQKTFHLNGKQFNFYGADDKQIELQLDENAEDIYFEATSLEEVYLSMHELLKQSMMYIDYLPAGYEIDEALYNKTYDMLNIDLKNENKQSIYILHQYQYEELTLGSANEDELCTEVENSSIGQKIPIYKSVRDGSYSFNINTNHMLLVVRCDTSLEECIKIVESVKYY